MVASVFGEISPKIRIRNVKIPVAIPAPTLPRSLIAKVVAMDEAERFTILLPIKMALRSLPESSVIRITHTPKRIFWVNFIIEPKKSS